MESYSLQDEDLRRASLFLGNCKKVFATNKFIRNFDVLDLILYIYRLSAENKKVYFSSLRTYVSKSDVYLSTTLKNALDAGFLRVEVPDRDKRLKEYHLTEESISVIERLKTFS